MKKLILALFLMGSNLTLMAQTKHDQLIKKITELQTATTFQDFSQLEDDFVDIRVQGQEKTFYPYYYAAYACIQQARTQYDSKNTAFVNGYLDVALKYLFAVYREGKDNPEMNALLGITYYLKSIFDVENQILFKDKAISFFKKGEALSADNERILLLGALLNGKSYDDEARVVEEITSLEPTWGRADLGKLIKN